MDEPMTVLEWMDEWINKGMKNVWIGNSQVKWINTEMNSSVHKERLCNKPLMVPNLKQMNNWQSK